jgi:hypothetical protein
MIIRAYVQIYIKILHKLLIGLVHRPEMAITLLTALEVLQACPTDVATTPTLNMVATFSFLNCISTGRTTLHVLLPFAPFTQSCIRVCLVFFVCLTRYERMVLEMALGTDLYIARPTDKRFAFCIRRSYLVNGHAVRCGAETV